MKDRIGFWILILLMCFNFFNFVYNPLPGSFSKLAILGIGMIPLITMHNQNIPFKRAFIISFIFLILSCISGYIYRGQSIIHSFIASCVIYGFYSYFAFWKYKLTLLECEKILAYLSIAYSIAYIVQYAIYPTLLFDTQAMSEDANNSRLRIQGTALASIGFCYFFNKSLLLKKRLFVISAIICALPLLLMGFRTIMGAMALSSLYVLIKIKGLSFKLVLPVLFILTAFFIFLQTDNGIAMMNGVIERQETDNFDNEDYVRILGLNYYMNDHFKSFIEMLLGSGMYYEGSSCEVLQESLEAYGIRWNDWGILGLSFYNGIFCVLPLLFCLVKCLFIKINDDNLYLHSWIIFMLLCSITTAEFLRQGNSVIIALAIYMTIKQKEFNTNEESYNSYNSCL